MEVVTNIIYSYLEQNRRITIPTLGTFLTKGDRSTILFSEFMKGDDGVLRALLIDTGMSDESAEMTIEQFVNNIRATLSCDGYYTLPSMGRLIVDGGAISFVKKEPEIIEPSSIEQEITSEEEDQIVDNIFESLSSYLEEPEPVTKQIETTNEVVEEPKVIEKSEEVAEEEYKEEYKEEYEEEYEEEEEQPKQRGDKWLIIPIIAAIFAIFALLYGMIVEWQMGEISFGETIDNLLIKIFW